ncbi:39S ribosomal protein L30, mitochondrial [Trichinella papuae]|uniref:39S ribosomal protein L30, mitochondrial n=1 Tax=Trichinella papuae TaxID=268474 RepID=A0A0V1MQY7_9BILA|nr:39S ribosomal protein L30, mitochondrial [Trichinella papuae]
MAFLVNQCSIAFDIGFVMINNSLQLGFEVQVLKGSWPNHLEPLHKYRYLPRPITGVHEFDYESMEATPDHFPDKLEIRPKLWVAWLYRQPSNEPRWIKKDIELLFGVKPKLLEMNIFKNMPYWNKRLWKIKHLIEVKPIVFPNGEPTEEDIPYMRLFPDGRCIVDKAMKLDTLEADELNEEKSELTAKYFNEKLRFKWNRFEDILEDAPWTDPKQMCKLFFAFFNLRIKMKLLLLTMKI